MIKFTIYLMLFIPMAVGAQCWSKVCTDSYNSMGLKSNGTIFAWGYNEFGQLGQGDTIDRGIPTQVGTDADWKEIAMGDATMFAIKTDGTLWGWGYNFEGYLGDGTKINRKTPLKISTDNKWTKVTAKGGTAMAIKSDGTIWAWGLNAGGFGNGSIFKDTNKIINIGSQNWLELSAGDAYSFGIKNDNSLWVSGANIYSQLGDNTSTSKYTYFNHPFLSSIKNTFTSNGFGNFAIKTDGSLYAWGGNNFGSLGVNSLNVREKKPIQVGTSKWKFIGHFLAHTLGIQEDGSLWGWGNNDSNQISSSAIAESRVPIQIGTDKNWKMTAIGVFHSLALKEDGSLYAWGGNNYGQLGVPDGKLRTSPTLIACPKADIIDPKTALGIQLYPNPSTTHILIEIKDATIHDVPYQIIDAMGKVSSSGVVTHENDKIDVAQLPRGLYSIVFNINDTHVSKTVMLK
jgi:hypothetical protein